jgi:hypothetical protein
MGEFNELIRNFDKIRDYMRDFYIYGFKSRNDYNRKSARTYDNEKRRIESYMGEYMKWGYSKSGKNSFISMDCSKIPVNPLYAAWKSKAFTSNDIMLHFYILDALTGQNEMTINQLTDAISEKSGQTFDIQTVRIKCGEYVTLGLLKSAKQGKTLYYRLSKAFFCDLLEIAPGLAAAISFFQGSIALGEIGSFIMDNHSLKNTLFNFKHYYVAHTLEGSVLLDMLSAIRNQQSIEFENYNETGNLSSTSSGIPLKVFVSAATGRRYLCVYKQGIRRFFTYRLDHIKSVKATGYCEEVDKLLKILAKNIDKVWGVGFGGRSRMEIVCMKLYINEQKEHYLLERIAREGHGGEMLRLSDNVFLYTKEVFDTNDMSPWIKTFIGRIIQLEGSNQAVIGRFYKDINRMKEMYDIK